MWYLHWYWLHLKAFWLWGEDERVMGLVEFEDFRYEYQTAVNQEAFDTPENAHAILATGQLHDHLFYDIFHSEMNLHDNALKTLLAKGTFVLRVFRHRTKKYPVVAVYRTVPPLTKPFKGKRAPWGNLNIQAQEFFYAYQKGIVYPMTSKPQMLFDRFDKPALVLHMPELASFPYDTLAEVFDVQNVWPQ